jgi:hypothetical protein
MSDHRQTSFAFIAEFNSTVSEAAAPRLGRQQTAILARLRQGPALNIELAHIGIRYSARIEELRKAGYDIRKCMMSDERGIFKYWLEDEE